MDPDDLRFFSPWNDFEISRNRLPHWLQEGGGVYFVTWRLADSIPRHLLTEHYEDREAWVRQNPEPWDSKTDAEYHRIFSTRLDKWMDSGFGECVLSDQKNAEIVQGRLSHFEGEQSVLISSVVMPNHVHALFSLRSGYSVEKIVKAWKGISARLINKQLNISGMLWQKDYFDRLIRDRNHFENCVRYIRNNPVKAKLRKGEYLVWESQIAKTIE